MSKHDRVTRICEGQTEFVSRQGDMIHNYIEGFRTSDSLLQVTSNLANIIADLSQNRDNHYREMLAIDPTIMDAAIDDLARYNDPQSKEVRNKLIRMKQQALSRR